MVDSHRLEGNKNKKVPFSRRERARVERPRSGRVKTLKEPSLGLKFSRVVLFNEERTQIRGAITEEYIYIHITIVPIIISLHSFPFFLFDHPLPSL